MAHHHCKTNAGHVCQRPSGRTYHEHGCAEPAGTLWGPYWCPAHDEARLDHVSASLQSMADTLGR
jgi:hypothetical protein